MCFKLFFMFISRLIVMLSEWLISLTSTFELCVLVIFHEDQTKRVYQGADRTKSDIDGVTH